MTTTIDWLTQIITIPKADTTLVQASPEVRELDVNAFRLGLKDIEDSEDGMPHLDTHQHNTEVTISGVTYARTFEIINGYTVEFEDGQYTVSCTGANHNLGDVKVANQVSLIINNAAGLINNATPASVAEAVWDAETASHQTTGTYGKVVDLIYKLILKIVGES